MKKLLLPLLACGMFVSAFAQIEVSDKTIIYPDKWVVTANNTKAATGRLLINFPAATRWILYVYDKAGKKYINSFSNKDKYSVFSFPPGEYKITLNNAPVQNVEIKKEHDTRLRTGVLDITVNAVWYLYDEAGKIYYASGNKPEKLALPVGNYILTVKGNRTTIVVNEFLSDIKKIEALDPSVYQQWVITPAWGIPDGKGRLNIKIPKDTTITNPFTNQQTHITLHIHSVIKWINGDTIKLPVDLPPNNYSVSLNGFPVRDVPIEKGKETRLKAGFLIITNKRHDDNMTDSEEKYWETIFGSEPEGHIWPWELRIKDNPYSPKITGTKAGMYALPPGVYLLKKKCQIHNYSSAAVYYTAIIKDGEWVINGK